ncbi:MAG: terminase small subunit [Proteobacteria bacterium]|nr:terminase small subunit [Pseudomonadota bacterium]
MSLNDQQALFVDEYLIDLNATQAAIRAGYSEETASQQASRLLSNVKVQEKVAERMAERQKRTEVTQDMVIEGLARVAFADLRKLFSENNLTSIEDLPDDIALALAGAEIVTTRKEAGNSDDDDYVHELEYTHKIKMNDRMKGLELLGRHLAMFTDKSEVEHKGNLMDLIRARANK